MAKDFGHQFVHLMEKIENDYQTLSNLVKSTWKTTGMAKNTMFNLFTKFQSHIITNKRKSEYCTSTLKVINKD